MTCCRSIAEAEAAADAEADAETPLSQEAANRIAAILLAASPAHQAA